MNKYEFRVVTVASRERGPKLLLGTFDTKDWGTPDKTESAARSFATQTIESQPGIELEIEVVLTKSETVGVIRL